MTMEALIALLEPYLLPVVEAAVAKFFPEFVSKAPGLLRPILTWVLSSSAVQAELKKYEKLGVAEVVQLAQQGLDALKALVEKVIHEHPILQEIQAKAQAAEASPEVAPVLHLAADEVKALVSSKAKGEWNAVRALVGLPAV